MYKVGKIRSGLGIAMLMESRRDPPSVEEDPNMK